MPTTAETDPNWFKRWRYSSLFFPSLILVIAVGVLVASMARIAYRRQALSSYVESLRGTIRIASSDMIWNVLKYSPNASLNTKRYYILDLSNTTLTTKNIKELGRLTEVIDARFKVDLSFASLEQIDLAMFAEPFSILHLDLSSTKLTEDQVLQIHKLPDLVELELSNTQLSLAGFQSFAKIKNLTTLNLDGTNITDEYLQHIKSIKLLRYLSLSNTDTSESAIQKKSSALPNLEISDD